MRSGYCIRKITAPYTTPDFMKWKTFLNNGPSSIFFQSPEFVALYEGCNSYKPLVLFAENSKEELSGVLIALMIREKIFSIPVNYVVLHCGPLISQTDPERNLILDQLLEDLIKNVPRSTLFVEIRNQYHWEEGKKILRKHDFKWHDHLNKILTLNKDKEILSGIKNGKQRQIRRGFEKGVIIRRASSISEVNEFYSLLRELYKKRVKKPLPPLLFFTNFYQKLQNEGKGIILLTIYEEKVIGGIVCPFSGDHTVHEWYIVSDQNELKHLYPGVLSTWAGIDFAIRNNFQYFDFMGLGKPDQYYGVRIFKQQFGGEIINPGRWRYVNNKILYKLGNWGYSALKKFFP